MYSVYDIVVPTIFGNGAVSEIGKRVKAAGCKKVLFIYDGFLPDGIVSRVTSSLEESDIMYVS